MRRDHLPLLVVLACLLLLLPGAAGALDVRIVGGQPTAAEEWPWMASIWRVDRGPGAAGHLCGGTLVAPDRVLTAAHCVLDQAGTQTLAAEAVRVTLGASNLDVGGGSTHAVVGVHVHPSYHHAARTDDVAVLQLAAPVGVAPLRLIVPSERELWRSGTVGTVLGYGASDPWGTTGQGVLRRAEVELLGTAVCGQAYGGRLDLTRQLCAGAPSGDPAAPAPDACRGDSGGPLVVPHPDGGVVQVGVTSFGGVACGVDEPGVYTRVDATLAFIQDPLGSPAPPPAPSGGGAGDVVRVAAGVPTEAIPQAVAISQAVFVDRGAKTAVLARSDAFPDALAGSALTAGRGPILFTPSTGPLAPETREELVRALPPGSTVYLLGGPQALPETLEQELLAIGMVPARLHGPSREHTAREVARTVTRLYGTDGRPPRGTVVLATSGTWPDAVLAGQLGAWWGSPILLTPPEELHPATAAFLVDAGVQRVLVVGGEAAVAEAVVDQVRALGPEVLRLAGTDRITTGVAVAAWHMAELAARGEPPPDAVVAVNLRAEGAFTHVLAASAITARSAGIYAPIEGEAGDVLIPAVRAQVCGLGSRLVLVGGPDLVAEGVRQQLADAILGLAC